jgi:hypothetical protein
VAGISRKPQQITQKIEGKELPNVRLTYAGNPSKSQFIRHVDARR